MLLYCYVRRLTKSDHDKKRKQMCIFQQNPTKKCLEREQKVDIGNQILNEAHLPFCDEKPYVPLLVQIVGGLLTLGGRLVDTRDGVKKQNVGFV